MNSYWGVKLGWDVKVVVGVIVGKRPKASACVPLIDTVGFTRVVEIVEGQFIIVVEVVQGQF